MSNILDWTTAALKKKADAAALSGNVMLAKLLDNCIEMYEEGLVILSWEGGEPYLTLTENGIEEIDRINAAMGSNFCVEDYTTEGTDIDFEEWEDE